MMNLSQKMKNLRGRYLSGLARIKTGQKICEEIQKEMQERCSHSVVVHFNGWWHPEDGEDARRLCWACGCYEVGVRGGSHCGETNNQGAWKFKLLTVNPFVSLRASSDSVERIMATPVDNLLEELAKIQLEYLANE